MSDGSWQMTETGRQEPSNPGQFIGRDRERALLEESLQAARAGRGALFLVGGEPGIGKTRLADEFARRARESGANVWWGRCWEDAGAPAYWPWIQALRTHLRNTSSADWLGQMGPGAADIARMLPEIRALVDDQPAAAPESDSARFQLFDSTANFLRNVATNQPIVLILDDLHSADTPSLLLLRFLSSQLTDMRVVAIGTYRDLELTQDHPLTLVLQEVVREPTTRLMALGGLGQADVARLIELATGKDVNASLANRLWKGTSGNPLFIGETVRLLATEGRLDDASVATRLQLALPAGVREVISRRVRQLSDSAVQALTYGSALGPEFSVEVLAQVHPETGSGLIESLGEATRAGLLTPLGPGRFRFSHGLVREAMYEDLEPTTRVSLHARIARALEDTGAADDGRLAELAHHYFEAAQGSLARPANQTTSELAIKAQAYARRAGEQAALSLAYEESSRLFQMALAMLEQAGSRDDLVRLEILLSSGEAEARAGNSEASLVSFFEAASIARRTGRARHLARAALGYGGRLIWARSGDDRQLVPLLQEALVLLGGEDEALRARLLTRLACARRSEPDQREQSDVLTRQAVDIARRLGDAATLGTALIGRFYATWWPENPDDRVAMATEMVETAERSGDAELLVEGKLLAWLTFTEMGDLGAARREIEEVRQAADELRQPAHIWLGIGPRTLMALMEGDFDLAGALIEREAETARGITFARDDISANRMHRFLYARERGSVADVEPEVRTAAEELTWYPAHRAAHALVLIDLGRLDEAKRTFSALARDRFSALYRDNEWLLAMSLTAEACALLADEKAAADLYEQLSPFAGRLAIGHVEGSVGTVDRYLGLLAQALGRLDEAQRHLENACKRNEQMGARPWVAHSKSDLAALLQRRNAPGDAQRAAELEAEALALARALGMERLAQHLVEGGAAAAPAPAATATFRKEGEYWTIVFGSDSFRLRDAKGLQYLARMLVQPGREFLALDLARENSSPAGSRVDASGGLRVTNLGDAGSMLDTEAKDAYRARLRDLQEELTDAEAADDAERADRARGEMDFLARELARAVGLGGRDRAAGSASERARLSVTRAIRLALERIGEHSQSLGEHLESTVRTGTYCSYRPDSRVAITWST